MLPILRLCANVRTAKVSIGGKRQKWVLRFLSYKHQTGEHALVYKTVGEFLDESASKYPDKTAYVSFYQKKRITFRELQEKTEKLAAGVLASGLEKGDRVGIWAPNSLEWYISSLALAKAGLISVFLNPLYEAEEIELCLAKVGVKMLITTEAFKKQNFPNILNQFAPEIKNSEPGKLKCKAVPSLKSVVCISEKSFPGMIPFEQLFERANEGSIKKKKDIQAILSPDDPCNIQFTSGTTGSPKGAVLSHYNIVNNSKFIALRQKLFDKEHVLCFMGPLFHAMGCVIAVLSCLHAGVTLVVPEGTFSPTKAVEAITSEKCTILLGTPTMYIDILKICKEKNIKPTTPEVAITGGAFAPVQLFNDMLDKLGVRRVASIYGLTETTLSFVSSMEESKEKATSTVGLLLEHMEAKVVDDAGHQVPWDQPGELWIRGYNVMKGYWEDEQRTRDAITKDNWFRTGDQFALSKDGYGRIVGRIKDLIIRGGENIYPGDVEECLMTHPEILDVQVVGLPDERLGEKVCASVRRHSDSDLSEEKVKDFCKGKIASFKIPEYVVFMEDFPRTPSGKVQKYKLRDEIMKLLKIKDKK